jgi:hypothetical protein
MELVTFCTTFHRPEFLRGAYGEENKYKVRIFIPTKHVGKELGAVELLCKQIRAQIFGL